MNEKTRATLDGYLQATTEHLDANFEHESSETSRRFLLALTEGAAALAALISEQGRAALSDACESESENDGLAITVSGQVKITPESAGLFRVVPKCAWSAKRVASTEFVSGGLTNDMFGE